MFVFSDFLKRIHSINIAHFPLFDIYIRLVIVRYEPLNEILPFAVAEP